MIIKEGIIIILVISLVVFFYLGNMVERILLDHY
jgi:hypothetical protein